MEATYRLNLEVCPEDVSELLDSHVLQLNNEDLSGTGERGVADEELTTETPPPQECTILRLRKRFIYGISAKNL